jgi:hypothetical protein
MPQVKQSSTREKGRNPLETYNNVEDKTEMGRDSVGL